jgi:hypothetical protein
MTLNDHRAQGKPQTNRRWAFNSRFLIGKPGNPMMERWRLIQTPLFGVYIHFIFREDLDPVPHDHPWRFWSFVLRGGYAEEYHPDVRNTRAPSEHRAFGPMAWRRCHLFPLGAAHRITSVDPGTVTLVVVGRKVRTWGFYEYGRFVDWRDALGIRPTEGSRSTGKYPKAATAGESA